MQQEYTHFNCLPLYLDQTRVKPIYLCLNKGERAIFTCNAAYNVKWFWEHEEDHISVGPKLMLKEVTEENQGYYECRGMTTNGESFRALVELELKGKCQATQ